jgi:hypothetical protein
MTMERSLEEVITEKAFSALLEAHARTFFRLSNALAAAPAGEWSKKHYYQLHSESDELESFLDDYGARFNRTFGLTRELVASVRWFALAGFSISHLWGRFESYGVHVALSEPEVDAARESLERTRVLVGTSLEALLVEVRRECERLAVLWSDNVFPEDDLGAGAPQQRLPRNVGQEDLVDEDQRIAEVTSKYLAACEMFSQLNIHKIEDARGRQERLARMCTEERARVYEATVHNLQSTYDTHIKNTVIEGQDGRLPRLRGHLSASLHLLEAVTFLTHFVERHESGVRSEAAEVHIEHLIDRAEVQDVILNHLLFWADTLMQRGRSLAEELLPSYTNLQELVVELPEDLRLHARPASLIVNIVAHYGTPVEMEVGGKRCNAGSILELLVTIGAQPDARDYVFRGDENPLRDIGRLFEAGLGEGGIERLPDELAYLRPD